MNAIHKRCFVFIAKKIILKIDVLIYQKPLLANVACGTVYKYVFTNTVENRYLPHDKRYNLNG